MRNGFEGRARRQRIDTDQVIRNVTCDEGGPRIGPVRLLQRGSSGWEPRPAAELNEILRSTADYPIDLASRSSGLATAARAMNDGDLARAIMCTIHMRLLPLQDETVAMRAMYSDWLLKASPDDRLHPGWPAGSPNGLGGKFRPKTAEEKAKSPMYDTLRQVYRAVYLGGMARYQAMVEDMETHHAALVASRHFMDEETKRIHELLILDDAAQMIVALKDLQVQLDAAKEFAERGPRTLEELRVSDEQKGFGSMEAFKKNDAVVGPQVEKYFRDAKPGNQLHHIVEQKMNADRFPPRVLHHTYNIIELPQLFHESANGNYSSGFSQAQPPTTPAETLFQFEDTPLTVRQWLKPKSFHEQWHYGADTLYRLGLIRKR